MDSEQSIVVKERSNPFECRDLGSTKIEDSGTESLRLLIHGNEES
jgi:hypothetical protein